MPESIRCALLGTGHAHAGGKLAVLKDSQDWQLVGVCEPDEAWRAQREKDQAFQGVRWLSESELLGDPSIRMIAVESEVSQLLSLGRKAIDAGKHIHLDKPAGDSLPQFRALLDAAERNDLTVQMGFMFRYNRGFDLVRRAIKEGWLGDIHFVHGNISSRIPTESRLRHAHSPGGMMFELACHLIDMTVLLLGGPNKVTSFLRHDGPQDDQFADNTAAVMEFDRAMAVIESAAMEEQSMSRRIFEVCGSRGSIILQPLEPPSVRLCLAEPTDQYRKGWQTVTVADTPRYVGDVAELAKCLRGEMDFPYSKEHDYIVQETVLRASGSVNS